MSLFALCSMLEKSQSFAQEANAWVYGISMVLLFVVSSSYHLVRLRGFNKYVTFFQRLDHAVIFIFIATSYTPWLTLLDLGEQAHLATTMMYTVWTIGAVGLIKTVFFFDLYPALELALFLLMGWSAVIVGEPIYHHMPVGCFPPLFVGGLAYSVGTLFFRLDGRLPFAHAIWHVFVLAGAFSHLHGVGQCFY